MRVTRFTTFREKYKHMSGALWNVWNSRSAIKLLGRKLLRRSAKDMKIIIMNIFFACFFPAHPLLPFHSALWKYNEMSKLTKSQRKNFHTRHRQQQEQYWMHKTKTIKKFQIHFSHKPTVKQRQQGEKISVTKKKQKKTSEFLICGTMSVQWELSVECKQFSSPRWHRSAAVELNDKIWNLNAKLILRWARSTIIILPCCLCARWHNRVCRRLESLS